MPVDPETEVLAIGPDHLGVASERCVLPLSPVGGRSCRLTVIDVPDRRAEANPTWPDTSDAAGRP